MFRPRVAEEALLVSGTETARADEVNSVAAYDGATAPAQYTRKNLHAVLNRPECAESSPSGWNVNDRGASVPRENSNVRSVPSSVSRITTAHDSPAGRHVSISPDGQWIAYQSNQSGRFEVYVRAFPGPSRNWPVSLGGGTNPVWSRSGRELFYRRDGAMMAVEISTTPTFATGRPQRLFEAPFLSSYDVARDGRFLMIKLEPEPLIQLILVQNWLEELKRPVPPR